MANRELFQYEDDVLNIWVKSRRCGCLVTWFCYQMITKLGNKTIAPSSCVHGNSHCGDKTIWWQWDFPHISLYWIRAQILLPQQNNVELLRCTAHGDHWSALKIRINWFIIWVRSRRCSCLVTWFCYHLIAKPGNKTAVPSWPIPFIQSVLCNTIVGLQVCPPWLYCWVYEKKM